MMIRKAPARVKVGLLVGAAVAFAASCAMATPNVLDTWKSTYPSSTLAKTASCNLCHTTAPTLNPYGEAIHKAGTTAEKIKSVESLDSDGDGYTNLDEITANTLPGDPASHPAAK